MDGFLDVEENAKMLTDRRMDNINPYPRFALYNITKQWKCT